MIIGIPAEIHPGEKRLAASPEMVEKLKAAGFEVVIESGAGAGANFGDDVFREVALHEAGSVRTARQVCRDSVLEIGLPLGIVQVIGVESDGVVVVGVVGPAYGAAVPESAADRARGH